MGHVPVGRPPGEATMITSRVGFGTKRTLALPNLAACVLKSGAAARHRSFPRRAQHWGEVRPARPRHPNAEGSRRSVTLARHADGVHAQPFRMHLIERAVTPS